MKKILLILLIFILASSVTAFGGQKELEGIFGRTGAVQGEVVKFSFPRSDLKVTMAGVTVEPGLALTSWAAFKSMIGETMAMGDLVLTLNEVPKAIKSAMEKGISITALHNHLIGSEPALMYLHFEARGDEMKIAQDLKSILAQTATPLGPAPAPKAPQPRPEWKKVQEIIGYTGQEKGDVLQFGIPRKEKITEEGTEIPPFMGTGIAVNFEPAQSGAATSGDFVLTANEVNPVIKALTENNIQVTAVHNHMLTETPRLFFLHFWGVGTPDGLARGIRAALDKTAVKK